MNVKGKWKGGGKKAEFRFSLFQMVFIIFIIILDIIIITSTDNWIIEIMVVLSVLSGAWARGAFYSGRYEYKMYTIISIALLVISWLTYLWS